MGILGIKTVSPVPLPVNMVHSIKKFLKLTTLSLVPLHSFGRFKFLSSIIVKPTFNINLCGEIPGGVKELKNSVGLCTFSSLSTTVSNE